MKKRKASFFAKFIIALEILAMLLSFSACGQEFVSKDELKKPAETAPKEATDIDGYKFSTTERPEASDFDWFTTDVILNGIPLNAEIFTSLGGAVGDWKGMIMYFLDDKMEDMAIELLNFNIEGAESEVYLTADWYSMNWIEDGQEEYGLESDIDDTMLLGTWSEGQLHITVPETIDMQYFYMKDGVQYAVGNIETSGGYSGVVAMCRP